MTSRFRDFVNSRPFLIRLGESEAAPSMGGTPAQPSNPTSDDNHFDALKMQMNIGDDEFDAALQGDVVSLYPPKEFSQGRWNMAIAGMVPAKIKLRTDGNYDVTFMLDTKKQMQPKSFFMPNQTGTKKTEYDADILEKKEILSSKELQGMMTPAYRGGGQAGGGMGGASPMGGGAPPMGGMGAPPI